MKSAATSVRAIVIPAKHHKSSKCKNLRTEFIMWPSSFKILWIEWDGWSKYPKIDQYTWKRPLLEQLGRWVLQTQKNNGTPVLQSVKTVNKVYCLPIESSQKNQQDLREFDGRGSKPFAAWKFRFPDRALSSVISVTYLRFEEEVLLFNGHLCFNSISRLSTGADPVKETRLAFSQIWKAKLNSNLCPRS